MTRRRQKYPPLIGQRFESALTGAIYTTIAVNGDHVWASTHSSARGHVFSRDEIAVILPSHDPRMEAKHD
jgi:hypothetical protein